MENWTSGGVCPFMYLQDCVGFGASLPTTNEL